METITLAHGNGGQLTQELIEELIYHYCGNDILLQKDDAANLPQVEEQLVTSTDSFVIDPIFFPGGNIGKLAVCGTVNDLAMNGAKPLYLTLGLILEEGLEIEKLERVIKSVAQTAQQAGVKVVAGDTKVVPQGQGGEIYINTTGLGVIDSGITLQDAEIEVGDKIIVNGSLGDHGAAVLAKREGFDVENKLRSDCTLLHSLVEEMLTYSSEIKLLRDPTRGGVANTLNEIAQYYQVGINLQEKIIPFKQEVQGIAEILGIDPFYLANEGKLICISTPQQAPQILKIMKDNPVGQGAKIIGEVTDVKTGVYLKTKFGGTRILSMLQNQLLPRIC
jgi:hydrogenase expression/formation protein HypE